MCDDLVEHTTNQILQAFLPGLQLSEEQREAANDAVRRILLDTMKASNKVILIADKSGESHKLISALPVSVGVVSLGASGPLVTAMPVTDILIPSASGMLEHVHDTLVEMAVELTEKQLTKLNNILE